MSRVSHKDLTQLGDYCSSICYHLTAHLAAVAAGVKPDSPPEVAQIYQLAAKLPPPNPAQWQLLAGNGPAPASPTAAAAAAAPLPLAEGVVPGKRLKWTPELEAELIRLVEDDEFRMEKLGKKGTHGNTANFASLGRHFGFSSGITVNKKYCELKGIPVKEGGAGKKKKAEGEAETDGEKPAGKKSKVKAEAEAKADAPVAAAPAPSAVPASGKKAAKAAAAAAAAAPTPVAAPAAPTPASAGGTGGPEWSKKQGQELVKLVEDAEARKATLGKRSLKWKAIAKHFDRHRKECRKAYQQLSGNKAPEEDE